MKGDESSANTLFYVARGTVIEADGKLYQNDAMAPHLRFKRGNIACLQNILPASMSPHDEHNDDVYTKNQ